MDPERPPEIDADYRVIHGPWPRWVLQISLLKLALWTVGIVVACCLGALLIAVAMTRSFG